MIQVRTATSGIDYTSKDYEAFRGDMIRNLQIKMPEYTDMRESDAGIVILELLAQGLDIVSFYQDIIANETFLVSAEQRGSVLKWCQMLSYIPRYATPSKFKQVFVLSSVQTSDTIIPKGTSIKTKGTSAEVEVFFETESDLVIPSGKLGNELDDNDEYLYTVNVVQGVSVNGELLGSSNNTKDQSFKLGYTPVLIDSINILVNEGSGFEKWTRVDNFIDSDPDAKHYVATTNEADEVTITFGNDVFGKVPNAYANGIYCDYRIGGGTQGNVGINKIRVMDSNIALVKETFNPYVAYENGYNKETLEEIKINAPVAHRTLWGALTLDDFADVVKMNFPDVLFAISDRDTNNIDDLHIYLLLQDNATLTDEFKNNVLDMFDENIGGRKIVGSNIIYVEPATLVPLDLVGSLVVHDHFTQSEVESQITSIVEDHFAIGNYPFDTELSLTGLSSKIMSTENAISGIKSFRFTTPIDDVLTPERNEIYTLNSFTINTTGGV